MTEPAGRLTEEQLQLMFRHMPVGLSVADEHDVVRFWAGAGFEVCSPKLIDRDLRDCHPKRAHAAIEALLADSQVRGERRGRDGRARRPRLRAYRLHRAARRRRDLPRGAGDGRAAARGVDAGGAEAGGVCPAVSRSGVGPALAVRSYAARRILVVRAGLSATRLLGAKVVTSGGWAMKRQGPLPLAGDDRQDGHAPGRGDHVARLQREVARRTTPFALKSRRARTMAPAKGSPADRRS